MPTLAINLITEKKMKIQSINSIHVFTNNKHNKNIQNNTNLTPNKTITFGDSKKFIQNTVNVLVKKLNKEGIEHQIMATPQGITVVEFKNLITITQTTTFLPTGEKKIIKYRPDGSVPNLAIKYDDKNRIRVTTNYAPTGRKLKTVIYNENGRVASQTSYQGFANFPKLKQEFHKDGKTVFRQTSYHDSSKKPKTILEFDEKGKISQKSEFDTNRKLTAKIVYDKNGNPINKSQQI